MEEAVVEPAAGHRAEHAAEEAGEEAAATAAIATAAAHPTAHPSGEGADETNHRRQLIKGGGAALTREKIIAAASRRFVCIADDAKLVDTLGAFPLPVEVIPMARALVSRALSALGGRPVWREKVITDNGNHILDVHDLRISDPVALENAINQITGVVTVGLFAARPADLVILGGPHGVRRI